MLFFGDGDIKCVEDDPDECGDGPHLFDCCLFFFCFPLVWHYFFSFALAKFPHTPCTYCIEYLNFRNLHGHFENIFIGTWNTFDGTRAALIANDGCGR